MDYYDEKRREATQHNIFIRLQDTYEIKCTGIFYDITDIYFYGKECSLAKIGHNSDGMTLPQLQLGLAVTRKESFPIFHRTFPGNIHDSKTVTDIMLAFKSYGIRDVTITWDRGVSSKINIEEVQQLGADVICGLSLSKSLKKIIDKHKDIISIHNRIQLKNTALYAIEQPHTIGTVKGTLLICHNPQMKQTLRDERHKRILEARDARTTKGTPIPTPLKKYFQKNGLNERTITESEKYDGISTLFSTKKTKQRRNNQNVLRKRQNRKSISNTQRNHPHKTHTSLVRTKSQNAHLHLLPLILATKHRRLQTQTSQLNNIRSRSTTQTTHSLQSPPHRPKKQKHIRKNSHLHQRTQRDTPRYRSCSAQAVVYINQGKVRYHQGRLKGTQGTRDKHPDAGSNTGENFA